MQTSTPTVPTRPRRHTALRLLILVVMAAAMVVSAGALRADATDRTTYTASSTQLVITYGAGADSIDVNVRYPDGSTFNHHPNRAAAVGEVLTLPLTGLPAWVQVHSTNCHLGEPGSPGYGVDCRFIEEEPCPEPSTSTSPTTPTSPSEPTSEPEPTAPPESPQPTPSETQQPEPQPSEPGPTEPPTSPSPLPLDPEPSDSPTSPVTSPTPVNTDPTPTSLAHDDSTTTPTYRAEVSAVDDEVPAGMNRAVLAATGLGREWLIYGVVIAVLGIGFGDWLIHLVRPKRGDE